MNKIFNALPKNLRNISGVNVETFKKHLDKFLILVPDEPNCFLGHQVNEAILFKNIIYLYILLV